MLDSHCALQVVWSLEPISHRWYMSPPLKFALTAVFRLSPSHCNYCRSLCAVLLQSLDALSGLQHLGWPPCTLWSTTPWTSGLPSPGRKLMCCGQDFVTELAAGVRSALARIQDNAGQVNDEATLMQVRNAVPLLHSATLHSSLSVPAAQHSSARCHFTHGTLQYFTPHCMQHSTAHCLYSTAHSSTL